MRLVRLALDHFKIVDRAQFAIAPITLLIGNNNAGKSTALQALALLGQSVGQADLNTRGPYVDLGASPAALVNRSSKVGTGWSVELMWVDPPSGDKQPVDVTFRCTAGALGEPAHTEGRVEFDAAGDRRVIVRSWHSAVGPRFEIDVTATGSEGRTLVLSEAVKSLNTPGSFGVLPYPPNVSSDSDWSAEAPESPAALVQYVQAVAAPYFSSGIAQALGSMRYLGVDRHFTQSAFNLWDQVPAFPTEQHGLATVLAYDRDIRRAVDERCREMFGFGISADFAPGRNVDLVAVTSAGESVSLNNMGAGFGQAVWLMVYLELQHRAVAEAPGRATPGLVPIVCLEEPELHLHPAAQPSLAATLGSYAIAGVHQLATTQSEHFLIALLQQVTAGTLGSSMLAVYHMSDGHAAQLEVDELGRLRGGLKGFFEANEDELLAQLSVLIRQSKSSS
jgi:hypothetical protein